MRNLYQVYGEYGGEFTNYKEALKCAKFASTTKEYDFVCEVWVNNTFWEDEFVNGKRTKPYQIATFDEALEVVNNYYGCATEYRKMTNFYHEYRKVAKQYKNFTEWFINTQI